MDIHKPKAAHSWPEFLIELGTIVCGILIALVLEQAVEAMRWRSETDEAMAAIRYELATDAGQVQGLIDQQRCIDRRLEILTDWAQGRTQINSAHLADWSNRPHFWSLYASAWEVTKTGAVAAHIPIREREALAKIYDDVANVQTHIWRDRDNWSRLGRYAGKKTLNDQESRSLLEDIGAIRSQLGQTRFNLPLLKQVITEMGVKAEPAPAPNQSLCQPPA